jgi:hypothetical protein
MDTLYRREGTLAAVRPSIASPDVRAGQLDVALNRLAAERAVDEVL